MTDQVHEQTYEDVNPSSQPVPVSHTADEIEQAKMALLELTPEGYLETMDYLNSLEEQTKLPEAGGFAYCDMLSTTGVKVCFGDRAVSSVQALRSLTKGIKYAINTLHLSPINKQVPTDNSNSKQAPAPAQSVPTAAGKPAPVASTAPVAPAKPAPVATVAQPATNTLHTVMMSVTPQANDKCKLQFYGNEKVQPHDKYPTLTYQNTVDNCVKLLANTGAWAAEHLATAAEYPNLAWTVTWQPSKNLDKNQNPYKNVMEVVLA